MGLIEELKALPSAETHDKRTETHACDLISRQAAIDEIKAVYEWHDYITMERLIEHIRKLPSVQPERKTGEWILDDEYIDCSACKREKWSRVPYERLVKQFKFCPNCGADMRGEQDG